MKVRANLDELADAIGWVAQALPRRASAPALTSIRITASEDALTLYAFDYEVSHETRISADVGEPGDCLVPGRFLREVVATMKGETVELIAEGGSTPTTSGRLTVAVGRSTYKVPTNAPGDYPELPKFPEVQGKLPAESLGFLLNTVSHAVSTDQGVAALLGVYFDAADGDLNAAAINRFVLAVGSAQWFGSDFTALVPGKTLSGAAKGLSGELMIGHSGGLFGLSSEHRTVTMRCYDADFPSWRALLRAPADDAFAVNVDAEELQDVVRRAGRLSDDSYRIVVSTREGELEVSVDEDGASGREVIDIEGEAREISLGVNPRLLGDSIAAARTSVLGIGFGPDANKPLMLRPRDHSRSTFVVMPKRGLS